VEARSGRVEADIEPDASSGQCLAQSVEVRQNIANIGTFVMTQTMEMQLNPKPELLKPLIEINCNLAAGLSGRA